MKHIFLHIFFIFFNAIIPSQDVQALNLVEPDDIKLTEWQSISTDSYKLLHQNIDQIALAQNPRNCLNIITKSHNSLEQLPIVDYSSEHCYKFEVTDMGWYDLTTLLLPLSSQSVQDIQLACEFLFGKKSKALYYREKIIPQPVSNVYSLKKEQNISNIYINKEKNTEVEIKNLLINQSKQLHSVLCSDYESKLIPHYLGKKPERKFKWLPIKHSDQLKVITNQENSKLENEFKLLGKKSIFPKNFQLTDLKKLKNVLIYLDASSTLQKIRFQNKKGLDLALDSLKGFLQILPSETKVSIIITPVIWGQKSKKGNTYLKRMNNVSIDVAMTITDKKNWVQMKMSKNHLTPYSKLAYLKVDTNPVYSNKMVGSFKPSTNYDFGIFIGDGEYWSRGKSGLPESNNIKDEIIFVKETDFPFTFARIGNKKDYDPYFQNVPRQQDKIIQGEISLDPKIYLELNKMKDLLNLSKD
ncbi:hypothetical protein N9N67_04880 [Bacteriovoracaceae bacterium]|nr:hypothetical protein [Bacteriovoracaceae bacterium]